MKMLMWSLWFALYFGSVSVADTHTELETAPKTKVDESAILDFSLDPIELRHEKTKDIVLKAHPKQGSSTGIFANRPTNLRWDRNLEERKRQVREDVIIQKRTDF